MHKHMSILMTGVMASLSACGQNVPPVPNYLIMLTETTEGNVGATFLDVESKDGCDQQAEAAMKMFPIAKVKYISHYCVKSQAQFETFIHDRETVGPSYFLGLDFSSDGSVLSKVTAFASNSSCEKAKVDVCVVSHQNTHEVSE